jgi:hypothetical protein
MTFGERADFILQSIASHDRQIGELHEAIGELRADMVKVHLAIDKTTSNVDRVAANVDKLVAVAGEHSSFINSLARIESHERRISGIEEAR